MRYLYNGYDLFLELDAAGNPVREYTYYPGVDRPHSVRMGVQSYYYGTDAQGHVTGLMNGAGQLVNSYKYTAWVEPVHTTHAVAQPLRYMAREYDEVTGLYYVRARWYDANARRFVSEDPIGLAGGLNVYAYVANSPTNGRDPSGLCAAYDTHAFDPGSGSWVYLGVAWVGCQGDGVSRSHRGAGYAAMLTSTYGGGGGGLSLSEQIVLGTAGRLAPVQPYLEAGAVGALAFPLAGTVGGAASFFSGSGAMSTFGIRNAGHAGQRLLERGITYQPRVTGVSDLFHNFPRVLDAQILRSGAYAQRVSDRAHWFVIEGSINGTRGVYEPGINVAAEVFHRAFRPF